MLRIIIGIHVTQHSEIISAASSKKTYTEEYLQTNACIGTHTLVCRQFYKYVYGCREQDCLRKLFCDFTINYQHGSFKWALGESTFTLLRRPRLFFPFLSLFILKLTNFTNSPRKSRRWQFFFQRPALILRTFSFLPPSNFFLFLCKFYFSLFVALL